MNARDAEGRIDTPPDRYFVTGARGFVGHGVCRLLRQQGHEVIGLARGACADLARLGVRVVRGDLAQPGPWEEALAGTRVVIHCAGNARFGNGPEYERDNVEATARLIEVARRGAGSLSRFVLVSTIGVIDRAPADGCDRPLDETSPLHPSSDYGRSKAAAERLLADSGLPYSILRPAPVVGAGMRTDSHFAVFARWALRGHPMTRIAWPGAFAVVHVDDLARAILVCARHPGAGGRTFLCGPHAVRLGDFFAMVAPRSRLPLRPVAGAARGLARWIPFNLKSLLLPCLVVDDTALRRLGWRPGKSLEETLRPVIAQELARRDPEAEPPIGQTVVTGAASGLGKALAQRLAPRRSNLLLIDRDEAGLRGLAAGIPHARVQVTRLEDGAGVEALLQGAAWNAHPVTELYACAGVGRRGLFANDAIETQLDVMRTNVLARMRLAHAALADMKRLRFGRLVLIASSAAFQPLPFMTVYAASNAALLLLGEGLAHELRGTGVEVMTVCPGGMDTNFQKTSGARRLTRERLMPPRQVAERILEGLRRRRSTLLVSGRARSMALLARLLPRTVSLALWGRLMAALR